jgi:hypothetical protein
VMNRVKTQEARNSKRYPLISLQYNHPEKNANFCHSSYSVDTAMFPDTRPTHHSVLSHAEQSQTNFSVASLPRNTFTNISTMYMPFRL